MARAAIRDRLDVQGSAQAFSSMMIVMGLAPILAPMIGAWILIWFPWQAILLRFQCRGNLLAMCTFLKKLWQWIRGSSCLYIKWLPYMVLFSKMQASVYLCLQDV